MIVLNSVRITNFLLVRKYHLNYHVPQNLALIVSGKLANGTSSPLHVIQEQIEPNLINHGHDHGPYPPGWKRPFVETTSAFPITISATTRSIVEFPEKDECMNFSLLFQFPLKAKI